MACAHVEKDGNSSHIGMLAVNPVFQGAGAGKLMLSEAEKYASSFFCSEKCAMVVVSERAELIAFYLRRGYQNTGLVLDYPLSAGAGIPKNPEMKIEVLEKRLNSVIEREQT